MQSAAPSSTVLALSHAIGDSITEKLTAALSAKSTQKHFAADDWEITRIPAAVRRQVTLARVGHFASSDGKRPALVPVCFVLIGGTLYHAIDAKPKSREPRRLQRVLNARANPNAALLVDHYEEDWRRLWYALFRGTARVLESGAEHERAVRALQNKYRQYRTTVPLASGALVIALDAQRLSHWQSSSPGRDRARRRDRRA